MLYKNGFLTTFLLLAFATSAFSQTKTLSSGENDSAQYFVRPGSSFSASGNANPPETTATQRKRLVSDLAEALSIIRSQFAGKPRTESLVKSSIEGSLRTLDPHSNYFDRKDFEEFVADQESEYLGIGVTIASFSDQKKIGTFVLGTEANSPARIARLEFGDKILAVDGTDVSNLDSEYVRNLIRSSGKQVIALTVEKNFTRKSVQLHIKRKVLEQSSIPEYFMLKDGIGYIGMTEGFNFDTARELSAALRVLKSEGLKSLILDLRGNPGGLLDQAVDVSQQFLPVGTVIVTQRGRRAYDNRVWRSNNPNPEKMPLIVLVDRDTASASEIVAGSLQDHDRALIVGERTFGKGLVQNVIDLPSGGALTLTGARYFTPSGRCIQRDYSKLSSYEYFKQRTATDTTNSSGQSKTDHNRTVYAGNGIDPDQTVALAQVSDGERDMIDRSFLFLRDYARNSDNFRSAYIRADAQPGDAASKGQVFKEFQSYLAKSGQPTIAETGNVASQLDYYLLLASAADHPMRRLIASDRVVTEALRFLPRAQEMARIAVPAPNTDIDVFAKKPVSKKKKQPVGSHRRRAENRRN